MTGLGQNIGQVRKKAKDARSSSIQKAVRYKKTRNAEGNNAKKASIQKKGSIRNMGSIHTRGQYEKRPGRKMRRYKKENKTKKGLGTKKGSIQKRRRYAKNLFLYQPLFPFKFGLHCGQNSPFSANFYGKTLWQGEAPLLASTPFWAQNRPDLERKLYQKGICIFKHDLVHFKRDLLVHF